MRPLDGIRVLNLGQYIAGPLMARLLADAGAEVTHVDPPSGPAWLEPAGFRGQQRLALDLKTAAGRTRFQDLLAGTDILIEGFRPGVMARLGLDPAMLRAAHPRLITCSLPGFGSDDPRASRLGWEGAILAEAGVALPAIADVSWLSAADEPPALPATPIASNFAAILGALTATAALLQRERDGIGQGIEAPLFNAVFEAIGDVATWVDDCGPDRSARDRHGGGTYCCADQRWVQFNTQNIDFLHRFCREAGLSAWSEAGLLDRERLGESTEVRGELKARLADVFASQPAAYWEELGKRAKIALIRCRTSEEWLATSHACSAGIVTDADHRAAAGPAVAFRELRRCSAQATSAQSHPTASANPLAGLRVLDISSYLAAPTAARVLGVLGADVVKINHPLHHVLRHAYVNRGKRTLLCDIAVPAGFQILCDLLRCSDVLVHNLLPDSLDRLGLTAERICGLAPDVICAAVSAYGSPGDLAGLPGYETQGQAVSGMMLLAGARPRLHPVPVNDYGTGLLAAFGVLAGLFARTTRGMVCDVDAALARTATFFQIATTGENAGKDRVDPIRRASDGWLCVCGPAAQIRALAADDEPRTFEDWLRRVAGTKLAVTKVQSIEAAVRDPVQRQIEIVADHPIPELGLLTIPEPGFHFTFSKLSIGLPYVKPGADTVAILSEIGRSDQLNALAAEGVVAV